MAYGMTLLACKALFPTALKRRTMIRAKMAPEFVINDKPYLNTYETSRHVPTNLSQSISSNPNFSSFMERLSLHGEWVIITQTIHCESSKKQYAIASPDPSSAQRLSTLATTETRPLQMKPLLFLLITWNKKAQLAIELVAVRNCQLASTKLLKGDGSRCLWA